MAERIGALVAVGRGVLGAAAADGIEHDEDRAGHGFSGYPCTDLRPVPSPPLRGMGGCERAVARVYSPRSGEGTMRSVVEGA